MPIFDDAKLDAIRNIIRRHHLAAVARVAGTDALTADEQQLIAGMGVEQAGEIFEDAYLFGQMTTGLELAQAQSISYADFRTALTEGPQQYVLGEFQQRAVLAAKRQAAQYIRNLAQRVDHDVGSTMFEAEEEQRQREMIAGEVASALETQKQAATLAAKLRKRTGDYRKDWDKVAVTELHNARQHGIADSLRERHGGGVRVFKQIMPDACVYCQRLHTGPDGTPRIFKLADLELTNIGRRKAEWTAVVGAVHPHCQCETIYIPDGWGFDEDGNLTPDGIYGVQYGSEEDVSKAVLEEQALAKALRYHDKLEYQGLPIVIENRKGSVRHWTDRDTGEQGQTKMKYPYGFIEGTRGSRAEGQDEYDVFVGPDPQAPFVFVVHQMDRNADPPFSTWDEDKALVGFSNPNQAKAAYLAHYNDDRFFGSMAMMPIEEFREKVVHTKAPAEDGMVKGTAVKTGPSRIGITDNPTPPDYPAGPTLSMHIATSTSQAGARSVHDGSTGPNLLFRTPAPAKIDPRAKDNHAQFEDWAEEISEQAEHFRVQRRKVEDLRQMVTANYQGPNVIPYQDWQDRAKNDEAARKLAPKRKAEVQNKVKQQVRANAASPYRTSEATASESIRPELLDDGRTRSPAAAVVKKGLGVVELYAGDDFTVRIGSAERTFPSLSAACDHVWCLQKGFEDADDFRLKTGKRKVPSGAGWKFWGLR